MSNESQAVTPYICCDDAKRALEFYASAFGATEEVRFTGDDGRIGHAEIAIAGGRIMLSDEWPEGDVYSPKKYGGTTFALRVVVPDVDALVAQAVAAGAVVERGPNDEPYGDRACWLRDPFGHRWCFSTRIEEVSKEELRRRMGDAFLID